MIKKSELKEYLDFASQLAVLGGEITLKHFRSPLVVDFKLDGSPVTHVDREVENFMVAQIKAKYPDHGVLGEEFGETNVNAPFRWIIDPIDGTQAFIHGVPLYTVLIGLEYEGDNVLGVIHCPTQGETVAAAINCGCALNGQACSVSSIAEVAQARLNVTDSADFIRRNPRFASALLSRVKMCRGWGDAYGYMQVATGRAEVALDASVAIWDCAALKPVMEEAGGRFTDFFGKQTIGSGTALASNALLHEELLGLAELDHRPDS